MKALKKRINFYPGLQSNQSSVLQSVESSMTYIDYDIPSKYMYQENCDMLHRLLLSLQ